MGLIFDNDFGYSEPKLEANLNMEQTLVMMANEHKLKKSKGFKMKKYQRINMYIHDTAILKRLLKEFGFKNAGNIYDYDEIPIPEQLTGNRVMDYTLFNRIAVSKENNSLVFYNKGDWDIECMFLISLKKIKKFMKISRAIVLDDNTSNALQGADFTCVKNTYLEISESKKDRTQKYEIVRKHIYDENLVFDTKSTLYKVKNDILSFFTDKTKEIYKNLELPFKRGVILYGEPGNGKSAMIREMIRTTPNDVIKIIIRRVSALQDVLSSLIAELDGRQAIIIMEDIDSMIDARNRSDILNVLDGTDVNSGIYLIGTTNYPEKLDGGFMNRAGRFDKAYKIDNPGKETRRLFFESRNLDKVLSGYKINKNNKGTKKDLVKLFVKYSDDIPMASLKELITSVSYSLIYNEEKYIENAVKKAYKNIIEAREEHGMAHENFLMLQNMIQQGTGGMMINRGVSNAVIPKTIDDEPIINEVKKINKKIENKRKIKIKKIK